MSDPEIFVSVDVETDGPVPGLNSMLSLGAVAYDQWENCLGTWYGTLVPLSGAWRDPQAMAWWDTQPEAWAEVNRNPLPARDLIPDFGYWCEALPGRPVAVSWPAAFDFAFISYYLHRFFRRNPLGYAAIDIRSYAAGLAGLASVSRLPESVVQEMAGEPDVAGLRRHVALDDAISQGRLFLALRRHALRHYEQVRAENAAGSDS